MREVMPRQSRYAPLPGCRSAMCPAESWRGAAAAGAGVLGLSIGANDGSPPPIVPSTVDCFNGHRVVRTPFEWVDRATNTSVIADSPRRLRELPLIPGENVSYFSRDGLLYDCVGTPRDEVLCYPSAATTTARRRERDNARPRAVRARVPERGGLRSLT